MARNLKVCLLLMVVLGVGAALALRLSRKSPENGDMNKEMAPDQVVHDRWKKVGYDHLLPEERDYIRIWWLVAEVSNGTFHQYFFNSAGDEAEEALIALRECGDHHGARVLQDALDILKPYGGYTRNREERQEHLAKMNGSGDSPPREVERQIRKVTNELDDSCDKTLSLGLERVKKAYARVGIQFYP
jgi:hypothetical protein